MDISIIIPVYNVENYLVRCLDSVFNQNFSGSFEVIAVEDFSSDKSLDILMSYKLNKPELVIVKHSENLRLAGARSSGMKVAKGKYLMHVDSDDMLLPGAIETLWNYCKKTFADVVVFNYLVENQKGKIKEINRIEKELLTQNKLCVQEYFFGGCWNKIVKTSITKDMVYSKSDFPKSTEDLVYCTEILLRAKKVFLTPVKLYKYFTHTNSITQKSNPSIYFGNQIIIINNLSKICKKYKPSKEYEKALMDYFSKYLYLSVARAHFQSNLLIEKCKQYFSVFSENPLLGTQRANKINLAFKYKYFSLYQVYNFFNLRMVLIVLYNSIKKVN